MERRPGVSAAHSGVDVLGRAVGEREADLGHVAPADGLDQVLGARYPAQPSQLPLRGASRKVPESPGGAQRVHPPAQESRKNTNL